MTKNAKLKALFLINTRNLPGILLVLSACLFLCACTNTNYQQNNIIFTEDEPKELFSYTYVQRGDVRLTHEIPCKYIQTKSEDDSFVVKDLIKAVYVTEGDIVKKGQLLAELNNDGSDENIKDSTYIIEKNNLLIKQGKEQMDLDLQEARNLYRITENTSTDKAAYSKKVNELKNNYGEQLEEYDNAIEVEKLKLASYEKKNKESKIYAGMSGTVSFIKPDLIGSYSTPEETVISIVDNTDCVYVSDEMDYKSYFTSSDLVDLHVGVGSNEKVYHVMPAHITSWKNQMVFTLKDAAYTPKIGDTGYLYALLKLSKDVLYLDNNAVHKANDEYYVYILDDQGNRVMQPVTIGLQGDVSTEIVDGLREGEQVILAMNQ